VKDRPLTERIRPDGAPVDLREYERAGGYQGLRKALALTPAQVRETVTNSTLRGRGGAGFSTGRKWSAIPQGARFPRYLVVNGDEMEPGTMKDRLLLEGDPHQLVEGVAIAAYAIEAEYAYIYLRGEYVAAARALERAIAEAAAAGYIGPRVMGSGFKLDLRLHLSAGRYMCGEESGLIDALEGRRANPRSKPPFPQTSGLWGRPTVVNNVETLCNVPHILARGIEWYKSISNSVDGGTKMYGASGRVKNPGVWELPLGATMREVLEGHAGGMLPGRRLRGLLPGGGSTRFVLEGSLDVKMDYESMVQAGSRLGTGTMIVLDDQTCPVGALLSLETFFARESCGWCTPCREGLPWVARLLSALEQGEGTRDDIAVLEQHTRLIGPGTTYCALAPGAMEPLVSALTHFRAEIERHVDEQKCPWRS
jgi:NADH-quinone oxidoreductase subunit F